MNTLISVSTLLATMTSAGADPKPSEFTVIEDLSSLPLLNPDLAERKTAKLRLHNNLEILLVSDPLADQSAAAMAVEAGSWNDPVEYPGMAHFCEHMLFMGTEKYPDEHEFQSLVSDYAGLTNAFTAPNRTVYMFASQPEGFLPILDRFARFFIDPLFNPSGISREMHAVDQEFAKNIENDGWREYMVFKETGNPEHPNRMFSVGNSQTLGKIPQSALKKWHRQHYGANRMHLAIYSSLPIDTLKATAAQYFASIPQTLDAPFDHRFPLLSNQQKGQIAYIKPVQNRRLLTLAWELPLEHSLDESKSAELFAYALERGQRYSLYERLKEEQLIDGMTARVDDLGGVEHKFFQIYLELTQKGLEQIETTIHRCFQAIKGLRSTGVPAYLFQEKNAIQQLNYQYQSREGAFEYITKLADALVDEEISTFPRKSILATEYNPQKIEAAASLLVPETCAISLMASPELTKVPPDRKEKWCGAEYAIRSIPSQWIAAWKMAAPHSQIRLADPNPYLPAHLDIVSDATQKNVPVPISKTDLGTAYYIRSSEYNTPESVYLFHILSPELSPNAKSSVLASLYLDHLTDLLHPTLAAAASAGLKCRFDYDRSRLHFNITGFSEKAPLLLQEIARQMPLNPPTCEQFALYTERHEKDYLNGAKELAARQAKELMDSLVNQDKTTKKERLAALKSISYEEFLDFHKRLFEKTHIEALFAGNLSLKDAQSAWLDVVHILGRSPYPPEQHPQTKTLRLPAQNGPFSIYQTADVQGNSALLLLDEGDFTFQKRAVQEILSGAVKEAFFDELRTKQRTGYIVQSDGVEIDEHLFRTFLVQSNSHQPEELLYRFELFLEGYSAALHENISAERFETLKKSQISSLKNRFRNLKDKTALWDLLAFQHDADFAFIEKRLNALESLDYEGFIATGKQFLSRDNRKRLAVLVEGRIPSPFAYESIALPQLEEIANYAKRNEKESIAARD